MDTQVRTPQEVFFQPQRIVVPLFQRPYVWNEESQWEPLWNDIARVALRHIERPHEKHFPHFLGAVVLQQVQNPTGQMQERTVIDGQQRLTTLQIFLDALHAELTKAGAAQAARRLETLVRNAEAFCTNPEDQFKVWPTNRDRPAFNAVMSAKAPVDYDSTGYRGHRMLEAHRFFSEQINKWINEGGPDKVEARSIALETTVRTLLQMVVIDLSVDENAQEIFETLNARGAQLTAADLIKNFVFQRLQSAADIEAVYESNWKEFETGFWETEISVGRFRVARSAVFFNHWLVARTGEEIVAREVFDRFKRYADHEAGIPMTALLGQIHRGAEVYRKFIAHSSSHTGPIDRLALFGYRTSVLESEVIKPLILFLYDPEQPKIADDQLLKALNVLESWMVRRMLVRATTKSYTQIVAEIIASLRGQERVTAGDAIEALLVGQTSGSRYWPDDAELREELTSLQAYRRIGRGRLRMILEAIEDHLRGWRGSKEASSGERVARAKLAIEHVMPRKWQTSWPVSGDDGGEERESLIHTLGNLTLLTNKLNSKASNSPWDGSSGKLSVLQNNDVLMLNREILKLAPGGWSNETIRLRTKAVVEAIIEIWPVPPGYKSSFVADRAPRRKKVSLADLLVAGVLASGITLFPRRGKYNHIAATLLPDGQIEIAGKAFASPSDAASSIVGKRTNGWSFFLVDQASKKSLRKVRLDYVSQMSVDAEDDDSDDDEDDES